jgi:hypothetical protein
MSIKDGNAFGISVPVAVTTPNESDGGRTHVPGGDASTRAYVSAAR